jgi:hypothetical protein
MWVGHLVHLASIQWSRRPDTSEHHKEDTHPMEVIWLNVPRRAAT